MPALPFASVSVSAAASTLGAGSNVVCILAPCATQADITPRIFGNANAIHELHGYSEGLEYAAFHLRETRQPVIFVALPIGTAGVVGRFDTSGNTDTSVVSVAAGSNGCLSEHDGVIVVERGGTVETDQIVLKISLDGGLSFKSVRLGTGDEYTIPDVDVDVTLGAGDLTTGETVLTWHGTSPRAASADITTAREALAADMKFFRSVMLIGDLQTDTEAAAFRDELTAYDTANQRFVYGRAGVKDRLPFAQLSTGASLTFANSGETITRDVGSWLSDGFRVGDVVTVAGSDSGTNDGDFEVVTLTALVMTLDTGGVTADETSPSTQVSITAGQTKAEWMAATTDEFESIDGTRYLSLAAGRGTKASPFTGWNFSRPPSWAASLREYQHDLHVATWKKQDGPTGWNLNDANGNLAQWDDRADGGAGTSARFTTFRTWGNGPSGAFIARDLTRAADGDVLMNTYNVAVLHLAMTTVQFATENVVGRSLTLKNDGTATTDALNTIKSEVNSALALALLKDTRGEGPRASLATWTPSADDVLNVADPALTGVLDLNMNGTIVSVSTTVRVRSGGQ
jgi:hypothetical protein